MPRTFSKGDFIRIRCAGDARWSEGQVLLSGGTSLAIVLIEGPVRAGDGMILNYVPITISEQGYLGIVTGDYYEIEARPSPPSSEAPVQEGP